MKKKQTKKRILKARAPQRSAPKKDTEGTGTERIAKFLARAGVASRRKAELLVLDGLVQVNGKVISDVATKINPSIDRVLVQGRRIQKKSQKVLCLNKPRGYLTTCSDDFDRKTIFDLLPKKYASFHPVGRLDKETSGLLLITNDGELTLKITHPRYGVWKQYAVTIVGELKKKDIETLQEGFEMSDFKVGACRVEDILFQASENKTRFHLSIQEGKKREIRRIMEHFEYELSRLHRTRVGGLGLRGIKMGCYRVLDQEEIDLVFEKEEN